MNYRNNYSLECWVDFSPQLTPESYGHYLPLHSAISDACKKEALDYYLIGKFFLLEDFSIDNSNFSKGPGFFGLKKVLVLKNFFEKLAYTKINIVVYEGNFLLYLFFALVSKLSEKQLIIHFNWSNDKQINGMLLHHYKLLKVYFFVLSLAKLNHIISYVENPHLVHKLNKLTNFEFRLFPTPSVFNYRNNFQTKPVEKTILIFVNDSQNEKKLLESIVAANQLSRFDNFELHILGVRNFQGYEASRLTFHKVQQISVKEYGNLLSKSSDVVLFYNSRNYETLTSGRFLDALMFDRPIWVPQWFVQFDWMGEKFGNLYKFNSLIPNWLDEILSASINSVSLEQSSLPSSSNMLKKLILNSKELPEVQRDNVTSYFSLIALYIIEHARYAIHMLRKFVTKDKCCE